MEIIIKDLQKKLEKLSNKRKREDGFGLFPNEAYTFELKQGREGSNKKVKGEALLNNIEWLIDQEIFKILCRLSDEENYSLIYHSAAFVALRYNLSDFIGNCYDAGATEISILIPENKEIKNGKVAISLTDNGKGFPIHMLPQKGLSNNPYGKSYSEILNGKSHIISDKKELGLGGHGGAGLGLARVSLFLTQKNGDIYLSQNEKCPGAKIILESQQPVELDTHIKLAALFGKVKDQQIKKIERIQEQNLKKQGVIFLDDDERVKDSPASPSNDSEITHLRSLTPQSSPASSSSAGNDFNLMSPTSIMSNSELSDLKSPASVFSNFELSEFRSPPSVCNNLEISNFDMISLSSPTIEDKQLSFAQSNFSQKIILTLEELVTTFNKVNDTKKVTIIKSTIEMLHYINNEKALTESQKLQEIQKQLESLNTKISPKAGRGTGLSFFSNHKIIISLINQVKEERQLTQKELDKDSPLKQSRG